MISIDEIKERIKEEKELLAKPYELDEGYHACRDYVDNNFVNKLEGLLNIDIWEFIKCYSYINFEKEKTIEECSEFSNNLKVLVGDSAFNSFLRIFEVLLLVADNSEDNIVVAGVGAEDKTHINEFKAAIEFIQSNPMAASKVLAFLKTYKKLEFDMESVNRLLENYHIRSSSIKKKSIKNLFKENYYEEDIIRRHNTVQGFVLEEERFAREKDKANHRAINNYNKAISLLESEAANNEIRRSEQIIRLISNDEIKRMVLQYIMEHNRSYYERLNNELSELSSNSINLYQGVLSKYNIQVHPKYINEILHISYDDLDYMLAYFSKTEFSEVEILYVLKYSNRYIVEQIKKYIELGYFSSMFLRNNINFFSGDSNCFKQYEQSLELLNSFGINPQLFKDNPMVLINDYELLKNNLLLLDEYELIRSLKNTNSYEFLLDNNLAFKLDKMIELGYYDFLLEDMSILNRDEKKFLRFELLNKMNMPVTDKDGFMEIIDSNRFIVDDDSIEDYLLDVAKYHTDSDFFTMENIMINKVNSLVISINDQLISYPKFKRKIREGYSVKDAVCFGKYFSEEEYSLFTNEIGNIY